MAFTIPKQIRRRYYAVVLRILRGPLERYSQQTWCGTTECIAGSAVISAGWRPDPEGLDQVIKNGVRRVVPEVALEALDLPRLDDLYGHWLFSSSPEGDWPLPYRSDWADCYRIDERRERQRQIAVRLLLDIADGKVDRTKPVTE